MSTPHFSAATSRNLTPFYTVKTKDSFAIVPEGMKLLEIKMEGQVHTVPGWFLKMGEVLDLNTLCHEPFLISQGVIPSSDVIVPTSLTLRALLFVQKVKSKRVYFQAPLPKPSPFGRSTEPNDDAQYLYGLNVSSAIGQAHSPDAYYQVSLVFDTRTGNITSGSKVKIAKKDIEGELSIIGYLVSGKLEIPEIKADAIPPWQEIHTSADSVYESSIDRGEVLDQGELGSSTACAVTAALESGRTPLITDQFEKFVKEPRPDLLSIYENEVASS